MQSIIDATASILVEDLDSLILTPGKTLELDGRVLRGAYLLNVERITIIGKIESVIKWDYVNRNHEESTAIRVLLTDGTLISNGIGLN